MGIKGLLACLWMSLPLLFATKASATTVSLYPIADQTGERFNGSTVFDPLPPANSQSLSLINVTGNPEEVRSVMEFPIFSVPAGQLITQAKLTFSVNGYDNQPDHQLFIYGYMADGIITSSDFDRNSTLIGTMSHNINLDNGPRPSQTLVLTSDITPWMQSHPSDPLGLALTVIGTFRLFSTDAIASASQGDPNIYRPRLEITYSPIPEPSSAFLTVIGFVGVQRLRNKRKGCRS